MTWKPLIGVTTSEVRKAVEAHPKPEGDPPTREMALGMLYMRAVERAGGLPVVLPPMTLTEVPALLEHLHGVCLSGGPDLDPSGYGAEPHPQLGDTEPTLDAFELAVAQAADACGLPLLGVCRGAQAMNIARGGTLFQHIADVNEGTINHRQKDPGNKPTHEIKIEPDSRLAEIVGETTAAVNSFHHQAIDRLGRDLRAVAWAIDGTIEAIEGIPAEPLFLGVQWHAESLVDRADNLALFQTLVAEASSAQTRARAA